MALHYPIHGGPLGESARAIKKEVDRSVKLLADTGSLSVIGNGNAAVRGPDGQTLVLSGFEGPLKGGPASVVVVGFDHSVHEGALNYGHEEVLHLHIAVLRERPGVNVSIHTHSPHLTAWALAQRPLPVAQTPELAWLDAGEIPVSAAAARDDAGPVIATLRAHPRAPALLIGNHGLLAWGVDLASTTRLIIALEESARFLSGAEGVLPAGRRRAPAAPVGLA